MKIIRSMRGAVSIRVAAIFLAGILIGCAGMYLAQRESAPKVQALRESDIPSSSGYTFTDPLLGLSSTGNVSTSEYSGLQGQVNSYITQQKQSGLYSASVKFADIGQSEGFTINQDETYDPASLTKVPLMMAYYYLSETEPSILSD